MASCPCCANTMLRHIRNQEIRWFYRMCWVEMPLLQTERTILSTLAEDIKTYH